MYSWTDITGDEPQTLDAARLRRTLGAYPTGVCLVTTVYDGKREGMTINSFASVSLSPPLVLWSIRDDARSADAFISAPNFIITMLTDKQQELAMHFAKPAADKFEKYEDQFANGLGNRWRSRNPPPDRQCRKLRMHDILALPGGRPHHPGGPCAGFFRQRRQPADVSWWAGRVCAGSG